MTCGKGCCGSNATTNSATPSRNSSSAVISGIPAEEPTQNDAQETSPTTTQLSNGLCSAKMTSCEKSCCPTTATSPIEPPKSGSFNSQQMSLEPNRSTSTPILQKTKPSCCSSELVLDHSRNNEDTKSGCCSGTAAKPSCSTTYSRCTNEPDLSGSDKRAQRMNQEECEDECCDQESSACADGCCGEDGEDSDREERCLGNDESGECCSDNKNDAVVSSIEFSSGASNNVDLEKGNSAKEHIILSVSGMTCTGCETKLKRVFSTLNYISNLKISLILARAEFDIGQGTATADDVIKHLHRTTEFKCERISNQGSTLDLICSGDPTTITKGDWPNGVLEVSCVEKNTIRVVFDTKVVGARSLLEQEWARPLNLAPPRPDPSLDAGNRHVRHMGLMTLLSAILTIPVLVMAWAPLPDRKIAYGSASLVLATIVQIVIAGPFYPKAIKAFVFSKVIEMDLLIVLSTSTAYIFSVVSFGYLVANRPLSTGEFFETSTLLVTLIMLGRWVASLARQKAAESVSIRALQIQTAIVVDPDHTEREMDARLLQYGDIFKVAPDSRIPTDGVVISGASEVDESMLTGESIPVEKYSGSPVIAGSINGMGMLTVRLTRLPGDNTITTIACMVDEAKLSKPKIQDVADKVASYFVPVIVGLTITTFVIWIAIGIAVRGQTGSKATIEAITYAITVLIVSCPCAIGLAVPMVIVVASGVAARKGVIFKSASSIEVAYKTTDVVFDKTGTLTLGKLTVVEEVYVGDNPELIKSLLLGLVAGIKHPVSTAAATHLCTQKVISVAVQDVQSVPGKGVQGKSDGRVLRAGNSTWLGITSHSIIKTMLSKGLTAFCFTINEEVVAVLGLRDTLRPDSLDTVAQLQQQGLHVHILSGDDDGAVHAIAAQLSIPDNRIRSRCSPGGKQAYIKDLLATPSSSSKGRSRTPVVMFVGDGTNDAIALAQATIGVHVSTGTDIAQSAADVVLVRSNLSCVLTLITVSRKAMHRVAFNFAWSFVYNLFAILLGAGAFVNARIPPEYAGLGELVSVLPVIIAASLLRWARI